MLTRQEIFDRSARHLLQQGERSVRGNWCAYRGDHGLQCAIGCLIPDDKYSVELEQSSANNHKVLAAAVIAECDSEFAVALQTIHDRIDHRNWLVRLENLAVEWDLSPTVLEEYQ